MKTEKTTTISFVLTEDEIKESITMFLKAKNPEMKMEWNYESVELHASPKSEGGIGDFGASFSHRSYQKI